MRLVVLALLAVPALAAAQPGPDDPSPPGLTPPIATPPPAPRSPLDQADLDDAAADRAYGTSTALVVPTGRMDLSVRGGNGGVVFSAAAGLGSNIEISGQLGGAQDVVLVGGDLKVALARTRTWGLAAEAGYHLIGAGDGGGGAFSFGGVFTYVADSAVLSFGGGVLGASGGNAVLYGNASVLVGHSAIRPVLEGATLDGDLFGFAGVRVGNGHACLDVGVAGGGCSSSSDGVGPLPLVGLTLRP